MKTKYLGIESIMILNYEQVTIACNVMFEGENYSEPIYINIFCDYHELYYFLRLDKSGFGNQMLEELSTKFIEEERGDIQIDLPDYLERREIDWKCPVAINLRREVNNNILTQCYRFQNYEGD